MLKKLFKKIIENIKNEWNKNILYKINIIFTTLALCVCLCGFALILKNKLIKPESIRVSLTYQNAANGLNPNGTRINHYFAVSEEVLEKAEEELKTEIDRKAIWISYPNTTNKNNYTTDFYINYKGKDGEKVLKAVAKAWAQLFEKKYTYNNESVLYSEPNENDDYMYLISWLTNEVNEISSYAKVRMKENNAFSSEGVTFRNIYDSCQNLINVDIENYKTFIVQNGISKDTNTLMNSIAYKDRLLSDKKQNYEEQYKNRRNAITLYDPTLFPTISVPSISSGTYYITTTKTGLDYIYDEAGKASSNSLTVQRMLREDNLLISYMDAEKTIDDEKNKKANEKYLNIKQQIITLSEQLQKLDEIYSTQTNEPYYSIKYKGEYLDINGN